MVYAGDAGKFSGFLEPNFLFIAVDKSGKQVRTEFLAGFAGLEWKYEMTLR